MTRTLLAVDGNSLVHRAFHAYGPRREGDPGMRNSAGEPTYAVYGFLSLLAKICMKTGASDLVVGFDDHTHSVRKARWPHYKAQRESKGPELYTQIDKVQSLLKELGFSVIIPAGLEADDVMASAAKVGTEAEIATVIATSDRDSFALISDCVTVLRLVAGLDNAVRMTPEQLYKTYGVKPHSYLQFAALRGDPSDNLPGVKGVGEKTAAKILAFYPSVREIFLDPRGAEETLGKAVVRNIILGESYFNHNMEIMEVERSIPVDLESSSLRNGVDVRKILTKNELPSLVKKFEYLTGGGVKLETRSGAQAPSSSPSSLTLF